MKLLTANFVDIHILDKAGKLGLEHPTNPTNQICFVYSSLFFTKETTVKSRYFYF
jgi:hypothetical protein